MGLALVANEIRVGRADDRVQHVGMPGRYGGHGLDHVSNALIGRQEAERHHDLASLPTEPRLQFRGVAQRSVRDAMRDNEDLAGRNPIALRENVGAARGHDNDLGGPCQQPLHYHFFRFGRLVEDGVQGHDQRNVQRLDELENVRSGFASKNPIFVL